jgi:hypothetical protein
MDSRCEPCIGLLGSGCEPTIFHCLSNNDAERSHIDLTIESGVGHVIIEPRSGCPAEKLSSY